MILNGKEVKIDKLFEPIIKILNDKGYITLFCCSGHVINKSIRHSYIMFHPEVDLPNYPSNYYYNHSNVIDRNFNRVNYDDIINNAIEVLKWAENLPVNPIKIGD